MAPGRSAIFVIDIQNDLATDPETRIPHAARVRAAGESILISARKLLDAARAGGGEQQGPSSPIIVFVQHEEDSESGPLVRGTEPWKLVFEPRSDVKEEVLVGKSTRSTFESNPGLADQLKAEGVERIITFGIQSECCVLETSKSALAAGFELLLLRGAHSTYDCGGRSAVEIETDVENLLEGLGAVVEDWESAVSRWDAEGLLA